MGSSTTDPTALVARELSWRVQAANSAWTTAFGSCEPVADPGDLEALFPSGTGDALVKLCDLAALTGTTRQSTLYLEGRVLRLVVTPVSHPDPGPVRLAVTVGPPTSDDDAERWLPPQPDAQLPDLVTRSALIARFGPDLRVIGVNDVVLTRSGLRADQIIGHTNREMGYPPALEGLWDDHYRGVFRCREPVLMIYDLPTVEGDHRYQTTVLPIFGPDHEVLEVTAVSMERTERYRLELPIPDQVVVQVAAAEDEIRVARHELIEHVHAVGASRVADAVELVVTELVTNAIHHGSNAEIRVFGRRLAGEYLLAVTQRDPGARMPRPERWLAPSPSSRRGRGLVIVKALTAAVDVDDADGHTMVRCRFSIS